MGEKGFEVFFKRSLFSEKGKTSLPGGYMGKILRVNLSHKKVTDVNLPEGEVLRKYLGGQGLGQLILMHELPEGVNAFSSENPLIITTGPLTGVGKTPASVAYTVTAFCAIRGGVVVSSVGAGYWGPMLKFAGYDGIIVNGSAKSPVYIWINNGQVEIRDAREFWGKDSHDTVDGVKKEIGQPEASVLTIGTAGENLVESAMVQSDYNHSASHGGGAVMGSKKLKAIAVYGSQEVPVRDAKVLAEAGSRWRSKIKPYRYPEMRLGPGYGEALKTLINRNWQSSVFPDANKDFEKQKYAGKTCFRCNRNCPYNVTITTGRHAGLVASHNAGSEAYEGSSFTFGIGGPEVHYLRDLIDRLGIEAGEFGCAAGIAFEAYEKGLITAEDTEGLELKWGDADVVEKVMRRVSTKQGWLGKIIAEGPKKTAQKISEKAGADALKFAVYIKGGAPAMHDWRPYSGNMINQILSSGGSKPRLTPFEMTGAPDLGYTGKTNPQIREGKAREVFLGGCNRIFCGAAGICWFGVPAEEVGIFADMMDALASTTGWTNFSVEEALTVGERIRQMEHIFLLRHGWIPEADMDIGPRFLEPVPDGPFKGFTVAKFLPDLLYDFYQECGWDVKTGKPTMNTLKRLGLEEFSFITE